MASPRNAGVKDMVKSLNRCRFSPNSTPSILLTIFNNATLAQAFPAVCHGPSAICSLRQGPEINQPGWQTKSLLDSLLPVSQDHLLANEKGRLSRKRVCCSPVLINKTMQKKGGQKRHQRPGTPYCRKAIISSSNDTTSCTLTPLTPKSRSITLNRAWHQSEQLKLLCFDSQPHTGSDSISQNPFQSLGSISSATGGVVIVISASSSSSSGP